MQSQTVRFRAPNTAPCSLMPVTHSLSPMHGKAFLDNGEQVVPVLLFKEVVFSF